ncbi:MAG: hypothetical protein K2G60_02550, partial [Oscillospiraceae bacterium]|nr:hypothetical protein [Oscillospiraceae bacterium]
MNKSTRLAAIFAAFICITISSVSLSKNAAAQDTTVSEIMNFGQSSKRSTLSNFKSCLYYSDKFEDISVPVLKKSRVLKNCFTMSE